MEMLSFDPASNSDRKNGATLLFWTNMAKIIAGNVIRQVSERRSEFFRFLVIILAMFFRSEFDAGFNEYTRV